MLISQAMNKQMNEQVGHEFGASLQYVNIAAYFDNAALPVLTQHFFRQADEERAHAMKFVRYILAGGGQLSTPPIPAPRHEFTSAEEAVSLALEWEYTVVEQINALLDRLEAGFQRERRLSSDIAHELKTPIAELRNLSEVGGRWPEDRAAVRQFFADTGAIAQQMERIVVHLLALARYDEGREQAFFAPVWVADVVDAAWKPLAPEAAVRRIELRQEIAPGLRFETDPEKFALIVSNVLANAVAYSLPGTAVICVSAETDTRASVSFSNRAENLEPADLPLMFDRFWRKDETRTGGRNVGLGLAACGALSELLGIEIETQLLPDRTFRLTLSRAAGG